MRDLKQGVAYVWTTPRMRAAMWIAFLANLTAYPLSNGLLPYVAREIYRTNQTGLGYLSASFAVGSLVGSVLLSLVGGIRVARLLIGATAMVATLLLFVQMQTVPAAIACLVLAGVFASRVSVGHPDAHVERAFPRPGDGRAHARDLWTPVGLLAAGSRSTRSVCRGRQPLRDGQVALMMAIVLHWRGPVACPRAATAK
jgi:MFS family permease